MCTVEKRGNIFILTLTGSDEHRLSPTLISSLRSALSSIKSQASTTSPSVLITTSTGKFFSNGFDLAWASSGGPTTFLPRLRHMVELFKPLISDLLSLPMPTISALSGHAAGAGYVLALAHDYVIMRRDKGVLYMSELDMGMTFPEYFSVFFRERLGSPKARREVMLRAEKVRAEEARKMGIVDEVAVGAEEVVEKAVGKAEKLVGKGWNGEVYGEIRKGLYPELCRELGLVSRVVVVPNPRL